MGGNFWKLGRLPRDRYLEIETELRAFLDEAFGAGNYRIPRYYGSKADFGDVDVLLSPRVKQNNNDGSWDQVKQTIIKGLHIEQHASQNKQVFSTVFHNFQVDFFLESSHEKMTIKSNFMDFNDLGNLIGRLVRPFGLKYGEGGLMFVYRRQNSNYKKDIFVSGDWNKILTFCGLDYSKWEHGFDEIEEMFEWLLQSPYFRSNSYTDPDSIVIKKGAKQRPTIQKFIQYVKDNNIERRPEFKGKMDYIDLISETFPEANLLPAIEEERQQEERAMALHSKFNGDLAKQWIPEELDGKALGSLIRRFNRHYKADQLLEMKHEEVHREFMRLYHEQQQSKPQL